MPKLKTKKVAAKNPKNNVESLLAQTKARYAKLLKEAETKAYNQELARIMREHEKKEAQKEKFLAAAEEKFEKAYAKKALKKSSKKKTRKTSKAKMVKKAVPQKPETATKQNASSIAAVANKTNQKKLVAKKTSAVNKAEAPQVTQQPAATSPANGTK